MKENAISYAVGAGGTLSASQTPPWILKANLNAILEQNAIVSAFKVSYDSWLKSTSQSLSTTGEKLDFSQALCTRTTEMNQLDFYVLAVSAGQQFYLIFFVVFVIFYYITIKHSEQGMLSKAYYRAVLLEKLDSLGAEVIKMQNLSGPAYWGGIQVFRVNFVTRRGHKIDGYFYVGHRVHGLIFGHIRFRKTQIVKDDDRCWF